MGWRGACMCALKAIKAKQTARKHLARKSQVLFASRSRLTRRGSDSHAIPLVNTHDAPVTQRTQHEVHDMSIHDENDGQVKGETLKDGILFEQTPNWLKFACPKTKPEFALKEVKQDGVVVAYEVPKSLVYFQANQKLADGST